MEEYDRTKERFRDLENRTNRIADLLETLAQERHDKNGHAGKFPSKMLGSASSWCDDPICRRAYELANEEAL